MVQKPSKPAKTSDKKNNHADLGTTKSSGPAVGSVIKDFKLPSTDGKDFQLSDHKGKSIVLYFYPKDATPGCTIEGHDFSKLLPQFKKAGALVFGISRDTMKSHLKFKEKECYTVDLLSDEKELLCKYFDVIKMKNMYGKMVQGIERSTFVIGPDGKLVSEWRKVKVENHAAEVLKSLS